MALIIANPSTTPELVALTLCTVEVTPCAQSFRLRGLSRWFGIRGFKLWGLPWWPSG